MRQITITLLFIFVIAIAVTSCNQSRSEQERKLIGRWYWSTASTAADTVSTIVEGVKIHYFNESYVTYGTDNSRLYEGLIQYTISLHDESLDEYIVVRYKLTNKSTWSIAGDSLLLKQPDTSVDFLGMELSDPANPVLKDMAIEWKRDFDTRMKEIRNEGNVPLKVIIEELDDYKLVTTDKDGSYLSTRLETLP